jgi:RNA polymerase sigma-70 factor, ECF subfamily
MAVTLATHPAPLVGALGGAPELDAAAIRACSAGDPGALKRFVVRYQPVVFGFLSRSLGAGPHVEDLAQEVFLRAFRGLSRFHADGAARVSTWLLTIATRVAIDARKRRRIAVGPLTEGCDVSDPSTPETERHRRELGRRLRRAMALLPGDLRDAYVLAEFHGLSMLELAEVLGVPPNTAKGRLFRARERLRALLAPYWEGT